MTLDELVVVIKGNTSQYQKSIDDVRNSMKGLQGNLDNIFNATGTKSSASARKFRNEYIKAVDNIVKAAEDKLTRLGDKLKFQSRYLGPDHTETINTANMLDSQEAYVRELKRFKEMAENGFYIPITNMDNLTDELTKALESYDSLQEQFDKLDSQTAVVINLKEQWNYWNTELARTKEQIDEIKRRINDFEKAFPEDIGSAAYNDLLGEFDAFDKYAQECAANMARIADEAARQGVVLEEMELNRPYLEAVQALDELIDKLHEFERIQAASFDEESIQKCEEEMANYKAQIEETIEKLKQMGATELQLVKDSKNFGVYNIKSHEKPNTQNDEKGSGGGGFFELLPKISFALLGIKSILALIRRIVSNNEKLSYAIEEVITGIAQIAEGPLNLIADAVHWIAELIGLFWDGVIVPLGKLLGYDMKSWAQKTAKSQEETAEATKQLASFDEINNIGSEPMKATTTSKPSFPSIKDFGKGIMDFLRRVYEYCKPLWEILKAIAALGLAGIITEIAKALGLVANPLKLFAGLALAFYGIFTTIEGILAYLKDPTWFNFGTIVMGIGEILAGVGIMIGNIPLIIAGAITVIGGLLLQHRDEIIKFLNSIITALDVVLEGMFSGISNFFNTITTFMTKNFGFIGDIINAFLYFIEGCIKSVIAVIVDVLRGFFEIILHLFESLSLGLREIVDGIFMFFKGDVFNGIVSIGKGLLDILMGIIKSVLDVFRTIGNAIFSIVENIVNGVIKGINGIIGAINRLSFFGFHMSIGYLNPLSLPRLATGTNYVPQDMIAMLHEGEAVVPKKYNPANDNTSNNEETNLLLKQLIDIVDSKEFSAYISEKEVGKSAVKYINNQARYMGGSVI